MGGSGQPNAGLPRAARPRLAPIVRRITTIRAVCFIKRPSLRISNKARRWGGVLSICDAAGVLRHLRLAQHFFDGIARHCGFQPAEIAALQHVLPSCEYRVVRHAGER